MSVWTTSSSAGAGLDTLNLSSSSNAATAASGNNNPSTTKAIQRHSAAGNLNLSTFIQPIGSEINTSTNAAAATTSSQHFQHVVAAAVAAATSIATGQQQHQHHQHQLQHFYPNFNNNNNSSSGSIHNGNGNAGFSFKRSSISNSASQLPVSSQNSSKVSPKNTNEKKRVINLTLYTFAIHLPLVAIVFTCKLSTLTLLSPALALSLVLTSYGKFKLR